MYAYVRDGHVRFVADGDSAGETSKVSIEVFQMDNPEMQGEGEITIAPKVYSLKILSPKKETIHKITDTPKMPKIECKVKLSGKELRDSFIVNWKCKVEYNYPPGSDEATFTEKAPFDLNYISKWNLDFKNSETIIGGKVKIYARTTIEGNEYVDSVKVYIRGTNPTREMVLNNGADDEAERAMLRCESGLLGHQFATEYYDFPNEFLPLRSDTSTNRDGELVGDLTGWGMCQLDQGSHTITTAILWDWTANLDEGLIYYNARRRAAENRIGGLIDLHGVSGSVTREGMIGSEAYAQYNGGPDATCWHWIVNRQNPEGIWITGATNPTAGDTDIGSAEDVQGNVERYLGYYNN